ncbi:phosphotransferase family protein [Paraburkholderia terrae]|uniref:phosphotransferase family protein n=1 Tax=Paraburkholderia terrae TaxID=311230 RepID=UPI00204E95E6|nr:aminoglycoside phosphotransferase family protein [Paraburkholderia terrae]BDC38281.1 putative aminoglycoside phosphotransferase [Paraburkholderia terrae]
MMMQSNSPDPQLDAFLVEHGLARKDEAASWHPLTGGVSSDIWRVDLPTRSLCVKRALSTLKVSACWEAPVSRNADEWAWMEFAAQHCPDNVPTPLAHDAKLGVFAMSFLAPDAHPVWKQQLMDGQVEPQTARAVGRLVGRLHAVSADNGELRERFDTLDNFRALRLDPYLIATSKRHPELESRLQYLAQRTASIRTALVHGDVSPKNILVGPKGPVLLDAECAWFGDPAFDLAFCLNHLLLKCLVRPGERDALIASFKALTEAYFDEADWELRATLEARIAELLPALLLARVDGKSPVEYLTDEAQRNHVRAVATRLLLQPAGYLYQVAAAFEEQIQSRPA